MAFPLTETELQVLSYWGIHRVLFAWIPDIGVVNRTVLFETEGESYALRTYRPDKTAQEIALEHRMIFHADAKGIPVVMPILLPGGQTFLQYGERFYALFPKALGTQIAREDLEAADLVNMGRFLARLNSAIADFPSEGLFQRNFKKTLHETLREIDELQKTIRSRSELTDLEESALMYMDQQREYLRHRSRPANLEGIAFQATHGDYHEGNMFFLNRQIVGLIDWDQVRVGARAWDAIRYANFLFLHHPPALIHSFLDSFVKSTDFMPGEFERTVALYASFHAQDLWAIQAYYLEGNEKAKIFINPFFIPFEERWTQIGYRP